MAKLERLAQLAKRKTLFDDRPVEIAELTYVIKQDLSALNGSISSLQALSRSGAASKPRAGTGQDQEGEHNKNVVVLLQGKLADVSVNFKEVLEVRTKNIQASRSRTENFVSSVSQHSQPPALDTSRTDSPLYSTPQRGRSPKPGYNNAGSQDILSLDLPSSSSSSALTRGTPQSSQQLMMMEEAQPANSYIAQRGEAIEAIERTINELGGIFGQLAQMVSEQSEMIQRIDANTEDVVDNVQGAQRELLKYWSRVQGNRWLVAKMFGVLMICESSFPPLSTFPLRVWPLTIFPHHSLPIVGLGCRLKIRLLLFWQNVLGYRIHAALGVPRCIQRAGGFPRKGIGLVEVVFRSVMHEQCRYGACKY